MLSAKPWRIEPLFRLFARLLLCFAAGAVTASFLRSWLGNRAMENALLPIIISILCLHGAALVAIAFFIREHETSWAEGFGFKNQPGWAALLGLCAVIIALPLCIGLQSLMAQWLSQLGFDVSEQDAVMLLRNADALWKQVVLAFFAIIIAPLAEELFFRGIIYPLLKQTGHHRFALWATALLFALIHGNIVVIAPLIVLAVILALLYEWTNNLLACIVVHSLFNTANFVMLFILKNADATRGNP